MRELAKCDTGMVSGRYVGMSARKLLDGAPADARDGGPKHGDDAGDGLRYVLCKVGFGTHYGNWLLIPRADGQYVTAAKLEPFSMSILRHQLAAIDRAMDAAGGGE